MGKTGSAVELLPDLEFGAMVDLEIGVCEAEPEIDDQLLSEIAALMVDLDLEIGAPKFRVAASAVEPEIGTMVDLEIGVFEAEPEIEEQLPEFKVALVKPKLQAVVPNQKIGWTETWLQRIEPHRRQVWIIIYWVSYVIAYPLLFLLDASEPDSYFWAVALGMFIIFYSVLFAWAVFGRNPTPCMLARSEKQLLETVLVVACACFTYSLRDANIYAIVFVLVSMFNFIPLLNIFWCFANIGYVIDCCLVIAIDLALVCSRNSGDVFFVVVSCTAVALQLIKDPFRQFYSFRNKYSVDNKLVV